MENVENNKNQATDFEASSQPVSKPQNPDVSSSEATKNQATIPSMTDITNEYLDEKHKKRLGAKIDTDQIKNVLANFIVPIASLTIAAILFFVVILPGLKELPVQQNTLTEKETLAKTLSEKKQKLNTLLDFKSSVEENNQLVSKVLTSDALVPQVLTQVDLIAREAGLVVAKLNYSFDDTSDVKGFEYNAVRITLGTEGNYSQVITFLENLENAGRIINVADVRFSVSEDNVVNTNFVLVAPYVELNTKAVTDDPIAFDITDSAFLDLMDSLKKLRIYDISVENTIDIEGLEGTESEGTEEVSTPEELSVESEETATPSIEIPGPSPEFP